MSLSRPKKEESIFKGQKKLISLMQKLGYSADSEGVCYGLALMGLQAFLTGDMKDMEAFKKRLEVIDEIHTDDWPDALKQSKLRWKEIRKTTKNYEEAFQVLSPDKRLKLEVPPFCEGIEIYQQGEKYPDWFEKNNCPRAQNALLSMPLILSEKLKQQDGISKITQFSGAYTLSDLTKYFNGLKNTIRRSPNPKPIALLMHCMDHAIMVGFDPTQKGWVFINANQLRLLNVDDASIAKHVLAALSDNANTIMKTEIFAAKNNADIVAQQIADWQNRRDWTIIQKIMSNKINLEDSGANTWLFASAELGDIETTSILLAKGAKPNHMCSNGMTALYYAAQYNQIEIVIKLIAEGANPNLGLNKFKPFIIATKYGYTEILSKLLPFLNEDNINESLYMAAKHGHLDIVIMLLKGGANPNFRRINNYTPLLIAAKKGYTDIVHELLTAKANPDLALPNGVTPLLLATKSGHNKVIESLLDAGANPNLAGPNNTCPLFIAAQNGHEEAVHLLYKKSKYISADFDVNMLLANKNIFPPTMLDFIKINVKNNARRISIAPHQMAEIMGHTEVKNLFLKLFNETSASNFTLFAFSERTIRNSSHSSPKHSPIRRSDIRLLSPKRTANESMEDSGKLPPKRLKFE